MNVIFITSDPRPCFSVPSDGNESELSTIKKEEKYRLVADTENSS